MIGFGCFVLDHLDPSIGLLYNIPIILPILILVFGWMVFWIAVFGCQGSLRRISSMLKTVSIYLKKTFSFTSSYFQCCKLLVVALIGQFALVVLFWIFQTDLLTIFDSIFKSAWDQQGTDPSIMGSYQTIVSIY